MKLRTLLLFWAFYSCTCSGKVFYYYFEKLQGLSTVIVKVDTTGSEDLSLKNYITSEQPISITLIHRSTYNPQDILNNQHQISLHIIEQIQSSQSQAVELSINIMEQQPPNSSWSNTAYAHILSGSEEEFCFAVIIDNSAIPHVLSSSANLGLTNALVTAAQAEVKPMNLSFTALNITTFDPLTPTVTPASTLMPDLSH